MQQKLRSPESVASQSGEVTVLERVIAIVSRWRGIQVGKHRFGGPGFTYRGGELGHFHSDGVLDLPFTADIGERLVAKGWADLNHLFPVSGWVTFRVETAADVVHAVRLLRIAYRYRRLRCASFTVH